jgi:hypothetical protein
MRRKMAAVGAMVLAAVVIWGNTFGLALPQLESMWMSPRIAAAARAASPCASGELVTTPYSEPSLVFLYGRARTHITASGTEAADAFANASRCSVALIGAEQRDDFLARAAQQGVTPRAVDQIGGRNYSNGDDLELTFYVAPPVGAADDAP